MKECTSAAARVVSTKLKHDSAFTAKLKMLTERANRSMRDSRDYALHGSSYSKKSSKGM